MDVEIESVSNDFGDDGPLRNDIYLIPRNTLNVDDGLDSEMDRVLQKGGDFGDDISWNIQSADSVVESERDDMAFGDGFSSMFHRLVDGFNGYKHDWYRRYSRYRGDFEGNPMERVSGWSTRTVFETTDSHEDSLYDEVEGVTEDEYGEDIDITTTTTTSSTLTSSSTTKRIGSNEVVEAMDGDEIESDELRLIPESRLEIKDDINRRLADESHSASADENNLLLTQMTIIIVFIMISGTLYVLWRYWLERRQKNRDLDYYRLSTDL